MHMGLLESRPLIMLHISISGIGAEVTQGALPAQVMESIYEEIGDLTIGSLEEYFSDAIEDENKLNWFEIDDNFHAFGPFLDTSTLTITDNNGKIIYQSGCSDLNQEHSETEELDVHASIATYMIGEVVGLTCTEIHKGEYAEGTINTDVFDPEKLKVHVAVLGSMYHIIESISYDDVEISNTSSSNSYPKDFIVSVKE